MTKRKSRPATVRVEMYCEECLAAARGLLRDAAEQVGSLGLTLNQTDENGLANELASVRTSLDRAQLFHRHAQRLEGLND